jgi:hypothetical protein
MQDDGGPGSGGGDGGFAPGCMPFKPPPPPNPDDVPPDDGTNLTITGVLRTIDLGDSPPNPTLPPRRFLEIGWDLDGKCTTERNADLLRDSSQEKRNQVTECRLPDWANPTVDGANGIDNSLGAIVQGVRNTVSGFTSENYTAQLEAGGVTVIVRLAGWNGQANDDKVTVDNIVAAPFDSYGPEGKTPKWDGTDEWPIASDSLVNGNPDRPKSRDTNAYVTNYQLVANLSESALRLDIGLSQLGNVKLTMVLSAAVAVCTLVPTSELGAGWVTKNCILGGRWEADDLLKQLSQFPDPASTTNPLSIGFHATLDTGQVGSCARGFA